MAQESPTIMEVGEIQFKAHDKFTVFNPEQNLPGPVSLLASSSNHGLLFVGNPNDAEMKVIIIKDMVDCKISERPLHARQVQLPSRPCCMATNCDGSMLAVAYSQNDCGFVHIYSTQSFTTANIKSLFNIRLPGDSRCNAKQLLWNPVIPNNLAVITQSGSVGMYDFSEAEQSFSIHNLSGAESVDCGSWSPKGKQIVFGFPNGKLAQYKPDLKLAKTIPCNPNIQATPFNVLAIQWLSTFQFAVVFLSQGDEAIPTLYIVNAPKTGNPTYTSYSDICYSAPGPMNHQITFTYIQQWNLLLAVSANGVDVGVMGIREKSEPATWVQYSLLDDARIEMPLTAEKEETYPIGFTLDTSSVHQLTIDEKQIPVMPMIHVLSTHGQLVSFNFLNLHPDAPGICSPPSPLSQTSGLSQFKPVSELLQNKSSLVLPVATVNADFTQMPATPASVPTPSMPATTVNLTNSFKWPLNANTVATTSSFNAMGSSASSFSVPGTSLSFFNVPASVPSSFNATGSTQVSIEKPKPMEKPQVFAGYSAPQFVAQPPAETVSTERSKPLFTVSSTFTPPVTEATAPKEDDKIFLPDDVTSNGNVDDIVNEMIALQVKSFDNELKKFTDQTKSVLGKIKTPEEMKKYTKRLHDLQDIIDQAHDHEFDVELQTLRNSLNEAFTMVSECRSKLNMHTHPEITKLTSSTNFNPINHRQLAKLNAYLIANQAHLRAIHQQIDFQWSNFQDAMRRSSRSHMHTPYLEGVYQRMTKLKDMIAKERVKLNYINMQLLEKGLMQHNPDKTLNRDTSRNVESLTDTMMSLSLAPSVLTARSKLTDEKLNAIRSFLRDSKTKISIVKPQRPDRVGQNSEVISEKRVRENRNLREGATTNMDKMETQRIKAEQERILSKPTATKALIQNIQQPTVSISSTPIKFDLNSPAIKPPIQLDQQQPNPQSQTKLKAPPSSNTFTFNKSPVPVSEPSKEFVAYSSVLKPSATYRTQPSNTIMKPLAFAPEPSFSNSVESNEPAKPFNWTVTPFTPFSASQSFAPLETNQTIKTADKENATPNNQIKPQIETKSDTSFASLKIDSTKSSETTVPATRTSSVFSFATSSGPLTFFLPGTEVSVTTAGKTFSFTKPAGSVPEVEKPSLPEEPSSSVIEASNDTSGFTFNSGALDLPSTPGISRSPSMSILDSNSQVSITSSQNSVITTMDPTDTLLESLNICKPITSEAGVFKPSIEITALTSESTPETTKPVLSGITPLPPSSVTDTPAVENPPATTSSSFEVNSSQTFNFVAAAAAISDKPQESQTTPAISSATFTSYTTGSIFSGTVAAPPASTGSSTSSIFGGTGQSFGTAQPQSTGPLFGGNFVPVSSTAQTQSIFGGIPTSTSNTLFRIPAANPTVAASTGSMFGGIPKPETSSFGGQPTSTAANQLTSGGTIFGGQSSAFESTTNNTGSSVFENSAMEGVVQSPTSGAASGGNIFSSAQSTPIAGGSLFAPNTANTGQPAGSIFGGNTQQTNFGNSNMLFGATNQSGNSLFAPPTLTPQKTPMFPTGSDSTFGGGTSSIDLFSQPSGAPAFGQPDLSVNQSSFGSPSNATAFTKTAFGDNQPTFGAAPSFGSPPSAFGSASTFGGGKGFTSFAEGAGGGTFSSPTQKNNLFEQLGSSGSGVTFGNMSQDTNQVKPTFGGSSFTHYRS